MTQPLKLVSITKSFGAVHVLNGISLNFIPGTVTAIVGDNGAGKSTLLKILAGVHKADSGELLLGESSITRTSAESHRLTGIEMVYQNLALAANHDIVTNLFLGRELNSFGHLKRAEMLKIALGVIESLQIKLPSIKSKVGVLSGGQQQAVAIARALLFNPKVLLLDEPTAALAAREVSKVLEITKQQKAQGRIVILVSHRLNDVFEVADRIVVLKKGEIFSDDPKQELSLAEVVQRIVS